MKTKNLILLCVLIPWFAHGSNKTDKPNKTATTVNVHEMTVGIENDTEKQQVAKNIIRYRFQCLINDKYPVDLTFEVHKGIIQGQIVYTKTKAKTPIRLLGEIEAGENMENVFSMREVSKDGTATGFIRGKITAQHKFEGTWQTPNKYIQNKNGYSFDIKEGKSYKMHTVNIAKSNTKLYSDKTFVWKTNVNNPYGIYEYSLGENAGHGQLEIFLKNRKTMCNIHNTTSAPAFNMGNVEEQECIVENDHFVCTVPDTDGQCQFTIYPFADFALVRYVENKRDCLLGMNATLEGIYLKVK